MSSQRLPPICGREDRAREAAHASDSRQKAARDAGLGSARSAFSIALHMHQPLIPAGGEQLDSAEVIGNLRYMFEHPDEDDNHNAPVFRSCYKRMGEFIPQLLAEGKLPRIMLDYSGCLLWGLECDGFVDVLSELRSLATEPAFIDCVEWLGSAWGHPVAPSTPMQDYRLHVLAWQQHFANLFGWDALERVRGFSPAEMAIPNHPDNCHDFIRILKDCGYQWILVQEHTVEQAGSGDPIHNPHVPHRLVGRNSHGDELSIIAIMKTQGSDTKLIGQMQPYYEATGLDHVTLADERIPPIVTQIADGENGGVMMNEFPSKYQEVVRESSGSPTPIVNVSEYLDHLQSMGIAESDLPVLQPRGQSRIWSHLEHSAGAEQMDQVIEDLRQEDPQFSMEGGSWTNDVSWVRGYEHVLGPMESASALFAKKILRANVPSTDPRYCKALYHLLTTQTSCYRYWGEGRWTAYGRELCRRTAAILEHEF